MKLTMLNLDEMAKDLKAVTTSKIYSNKSGFHPDGPFSERIFGPTKTGFCSCGLWWGRERFGEMCNQCGVTISHSNTRRTTFAKIELPFPVINPIMYYLINKAGKVTYAKIMDNLINEERCSYYYSEKSKKYIKSMDPLHENEEEVEYPEGVTVYRGYEGLHDLIYSEAESRKEDDDSWEFIYDNWDNFYMNNIIINPPEFRPVSKSKDSQMRDEMNKHYTTILNFKAINEQENLDTYSHPDISLVNFKNLQNHIFTLYEFIFGKFSKKTGLIRGDILGKRVDFSGRAVITPDPTLKVDECSVSYLMLLELFKLDIANVLLEKRIHNRYDSAIKYIDKCIKLQDYDLLDIVISITKGRYCMLNRQPTLHRLGLLAFKITVNTEYVIKIHPFVCEPYNADFDGDQMAIYIPLYDETEKECIEKISIANNLISPSTNTVSIGINQDVILGLYYLTKEGETEDVMHDGINTTKGRVRFNSLFPDDFPFVNKTITKDVAKGIINDLVINYESSIGIKILDKIKVLGLKETTKRGCTMSLKNIKFEEANDIVNGICDDDAMDVKEKYFALQETSIKERLRASFPYTDFIESGSRGSWDQAKQLTFCRGYISNSKGEVITTPIKSNLLDGLTREEFFISCYGSRKALLDVALNTGVSGYLTRKLVYCGVNLELGGKNDCGTDGTYNFLIPTIEEDSNAKKLAKSIIGRWNVINEGGENVLRLITNENYNDLLGTQVRLRSPIFCKHHGICKTCYGITSDSIHTKYIGVIAASALGEVATQLTLRTFHIGGIAMMSKDGEDTSQKDIINDLTLVKNLLHCRDHLGFDQTIKKLFDIYVSHTSLLLVHFESIVSQLMRKENKRWRTQEDRNIEEYEMVSIDSVPEKESFLLALAFAKPYTYIVNGILQKLDSTNGILEKIMTNDI